MDSGGTFDEKVTMIRNLLSKGVSEISDPQAQYELMNLLGPGSFELEDITDRPDLPPNLQSDTTRTILVTDGLVKSGRTYALRYRPSDTMNEFKMLCYNLDGAVNPAGLVLPTSSPNARWKQFQGLYLTFWTTRNRVAKDTVTPRTIQLEIIETFPTLTLRPTEVDLLTIAPLTQTAPQNTLTMLYQVDALHNPTHQTMSDIIVTAQNIILPLHYELRLTIQPILPPGAATVICDAFIMMKNLR
jgi:hypothetical protein